MPLVMFLSVCLAASAPGAEPTARFPKGTRPMEMGPPPAGLDRWDVAECARCHPDQTRAWERSGHASARSDFLFQAALRDDPPEWCIRCHAPAASRTSDRLLPAGAEAEERGVTCAACHATSGAVAAPEVSARAPHTARAEPSLRDPAFCARCHQFGFVTSQSGSVGLELSLGRMQQDTYGEWLAWRDTRGDTRTCQDCHMPGGDHAFGGIRREEALRRALEVAVAPGAKALTLRTRGVGHAFPTGDIMRWLSVEVAADELFTEPVTVARFGRTLGMHTWPGEPRRNLGVVSDTRLPASGAPAIRVELPAPPRGRRWIAWRLIYHLVSERQEHSGSVPPAVSRIELHAGLLLP